MGLRWNKWLATEAAKVTDGRCPITIRLHDISYEERQQTQVEGKGKKGVKREGGKGGIEKKRGREKRK